ncbi:DUF5996 family protein [Microbulbifer variabilis]|uniref:DUF5996 family protein n=1 Tax=Microbulbifer variabilis TaxID=266805 RepID=UPI001CFEC4B0|nr:DUF5996 family protein [Microbulbifer variabilis]
MKASLNRSTNTDWPELHFQDWSDTAATLHLWTQVIGKIRMVQSPWTNHSWHVPFYVTARGLNTSLIPYGGRAFSVEFDLLDHQLLILVSDGGKQKIPLRPMCVADFYMKVISAMKDLGLSVDIYTIPSEIANGTPFEVDMAHCQYDSKFTTRFWQALLQIDRVFKEFRARFIGKCSPVHFFWGSFDLAVTRFSGREAPLHPGGVPNFPDWVAQEAYSHEVSSAGFWPGGGGFEDAAFYSYTYPASEKFADKQVKPDAAFYSKELAEFILPYDEVRRSTSPDETLMTFLQSTYEAAANTGEWDRSALEKNFTTFQPGFPG